MLLEPKPEIELEVERKVESRASPDKKYDSPDSPCVYSDITSNRSGGIRMERRV
jgi:hypothetical protein